MNISYPDFINIVVLTLMVVIGIVLVICLLKCDDLIAMLITIIYVVICGAIFNLVVDFNDKNRYIYPDFIDSGTIVSKTRYLGSYCLRVKNDSSDRTQLYSVDESVYEDAKIGEEIEFDKNSMKVKQES